MSFCVLPLLQSVITSVFNLHTVFFCIPYWLFQLCPNLFPRVSCLSDALADLMRIYKSKICTLVMVCIYNLIFSSPAVACGLQVDRSVGRPLQTLCTRLQWQRKKQMVEESEVFMCMNAGCDVACDGCTGPGPENCDVCYERHYTDDSGTCRRMSTLNSSHLPLFCILKFICLMLLYRIS